MVRPKIREDIVFAQIPALPLTRPRHLTNDCYFYGEKEVKGGLAGRTEASQALERDRSERSERWGLH